MTTNDSKGRDPICLRSSPFFSFGFLFSLGIAVFGAVSIFIINIFDYHGALFLIILGVVGMIFTLVIGRFV